MSPGCRESTNQQLQPRGGSQIGDQLRPAAFFVLRILKKYRKEICQPHAKHTRHSTHVINQVTLFLALNESSQIKPAGHAGLMYITLDSSSSNDMYLPRPCASCNCTVSFVERVQDVQAKSILLSVSSFRFFWDPRATYLMITLSMGNPHLGQHI